MREVALALYFDEDPIDNSKIRVEVGREVSERYPHARVSGWFGAGAIFIEALLPPDHEMFMLAGLLITEVEEHDDAGRPVKVWAARALPESVGFPPYEHTDWEYATSPATITYGPEPVAVWDQDDITRAAFAWARDGGRPRMVGGTPPVSFDLG